MKYIGPFFRMNSLNYENIRNQLFHLSKESVKHITLHSKCGITVPVSELKLKNIPNIDINTINSFSPLICVYKKANPKIISKDKHHFWDEDTFKKEVNIESNAFMTLSLLELVDFYKAFSETDKKKYSLYNLYLELAKKQLEFYASHLRNSYGLFVDKKNCSGHNLNDLKFEEKGKKFKYSDQALIMAAYYKYSIFDESSTGIEFKSFSLEILNMFLKYREDLYNLSLEELTKITLALNVMFTYIKTDEIKSLLLDLAELISDNYADISNFSSENKLEYECLLLIDSLLIYRNLNIHKFESLAKALYEKLIALYDPDLCIFVKASEGKEITLSSLEILLYLLSMMLYSKTIEAEEENNYIIVNVFKRMVIESGIILSWPASPDIDDVERYRNYSLKSDDLLDEQEFRMPSLPTPESCEDAPVFIKYVTFNRKKEKFNQNKLTFDSTKNMLIYFLIIFLYNMPLIGAEEK